MGKASIVQVRRDRLLHIHDVLMAQAIELLGGDARLDVGTDHVEDFSREASRFAHLGVARLGFS